MYELAILISRVQLDGTPSLQECIRPLLYDYDNQIGKGPPNDACRDVVVPHKVEHWYKYLNSKFVIEDLEEQRTKFHKFSDEEAFQILWDRYVNRMAHDFLVDKYECGRQTIIDIVKRRRYKWIDVSEITKVTKITEEAMRTKRFNF